MINNIPLPHYFWSTKRHNASTYTCSIETLIKYKCYFDFANQQFKAVSSTGLHPSHNFNTEGGGLEWAWDFTWIACMASKACGSLHFAGMPGCAGYHIKDRFSKISPDFKCCIHFQKTNPVQQHTPIWSAHQCLPHTHPPWLPSELLLNEWHNFRWWMYFNTI